MTELLGPAADVDVAAPYIGIAADGNLAILEGW